MVAEMLIFFTLIFWSIARVKLLGDVQAIAFFLHLFVLASRNSWVLSLGGCRGVAREGARGARAPRNLADQLTLFKPGGTYYAPHTPASPHGFKKLSTPLGCISRLMPENGGNYIYLVSNPVVRIVRNCIQDYIKNI